MKTGSLDLNTHDIFSTHLPQNERIKQNPALLNDEKPSSIETNDRDDHGSVAITRIESQRSSTSKHWLAGSAAEYGTCRQYYFRRRPDHQHEACVCGLEACRASVLIESMPLPHFGQESCSFDRCSIDSRWNQWAHGSLVASYCARQTGHTSWPILPATEPSIFSFGKASIAQAGGLPVKPEASGIVVSGLLG